MIRIALAVIVAGAVTIPLVSQVRSAQQGAASSAGGASAPAAGSLGGLALPASRPAVDPNKVIATAGDVKVTVGEFESVLQGVPPQYAAQIEQPAFRKNIIDRLVGIKLAAREAERLKLDQTDDVKMKLELSRDQILAGEYEGQLQKSDDVADKAYYDANPSLFNNVQARHILIRTPGSRVPVDPGKKELTEAEAKAKADEIEKKLQTGGDFAALAKAESDDKGSGIKGGDLGTFSPWRMDPVFSKAALALKKNEISPPVRTQFGYHIIQLLDNQPRDYTASKSEIAQARVSVALNEMSGKNKTDYDQDFVDNKPAGAATQPAAK
jgi:parvulin-like peptidyl-prolyl isomerase